MARFPKKLILVAALAELLILATAGRSEVLPPNPAQFGAHSISAMSASTHATRQATPARRPAVKAKESPHAI